MKHERQEPKAELGPRDHFFIFLLAVIAIVARRPDSVLHAQFWAEDGRVWTANAYNLGWARALLHPQDGYIQTLPRLGAALALLFPFAFAPLVLSSIAILFQALPVNLLLSERSSGWGNLRFRSLCAAVYLALPNSDEIAGTITNSQWMLALCVFLLLVTPRPRSPPARALDVVLLVLCGLTGPFCLFLVPIAIFLAIRTCESWRWVRCGILATLCLFQILSLARGMHGSRPHHILGASFALFARLLGGHIYVATLFGHNGQASRTVPLLIAGFSISPALIFLTLAGAAVGGTVFIAICFFRSALSMRLFILLSGSFFLASLITPAVYPPAGMSVWEALVAAGPVRYWFFPSLAFAWSILWCLRTATGVLRIVSACLLLCMCIGMAVDWRHEPLQDMRFAENVKRFEDAPVGATVVIPLNPAPWDMKLVKQARRW